MKKGFALIGAGLFGERHAQAYSRHPAVDFVAVCDLNGDRAKEIAEKYNARGYTTEYQDLLSNLEIEAVSVATPDHLHREVAVAFAEAGKHLLVEKPLATTVEDAEAIAGAAQCARRHSARRYRHAHIRICPSEQHNHGRHKHAYVGEPVFGSMVLGEPYYRRRSLDVG
jgi:predicted dehydrogenase